MGAHCSFRPGGGALHREPEQPAPPGSQPAEKVGVCVGGGQTSCPGFGLLPAGAGRRCVWTEFGTDGRTAAGDGQVRSGAGGQTTLPRPGGPRKGGDRHRLLGGSGRVRPRRGQGSRPPWAPLWDLGDPGAASLKPQGLDLSPCRVLRPVFRLLCLVSGAEAREQDRPEKAGVIGSPGRGLPDCACSRGLPADSGALHGGRCNRGIRCQGDSALDTSSRSYHLLSYIPLLSGSGRTEAAHLERLDCGFLQRLRGVWAVFTACAHFAG